MERALSGENPGLSFLRLYVRILARNILFLFGGRGPTPEELDEKGDFRTR